MLKHTLLAGLVLGVFAAAALAAGIGGTVIDVQKNKVQIVTSSAPESWVRKGVAVRILGGRGTIVEVRADTVSVTTAKPPAVKAGDKVTFEKARSTAGGC